MEEMEYSQPLRVLAADDSAVMRGILRTIFELHARDRESALPKMELCGVVSNGLEALAAIKALQPDILLLDLEMPRMGGLGVLDRLRELLPSLPVIMCSTHTERGAARTLEALAHGARDYVTKPSRQSDFSNAIGLLAQQLLPKVAALAVRRRSAAGPVAAPAACRKASAHEAERQPLSMRDDASLEVDAPLRREEAALRLVVIGVSTGGPSALEILLPMLSTNLSAPTLSMPTLPVPILVVQHMPKLFTGVLAARLAKVCDVPVAEAQEGENLAAGQILLAPGDAHMEVTQGALRGTLFPKIRLHQGPALNSCKPSVDYLFSSAARLFGPGVLAIVLTGMGSDGLEGARAVRAAGGTVLAQDEASSAVWGMPGRVAREGIAHATLPLQGIARAVRQRVHANRNENLIPAGVGALHAVAQPASREARLAMF